MFKQQYLTFSLLTTGLPAAVGGCFASCDCKKNKQIHVVFSIRVIKNTNPNFIGNGVK